MGRRSASVADPSRWVFNRLAEAYRLRPPYPAALVDRLAQAAGGPGARVADLGAGAGHLALPLAARGLRVAAVEPARAMLHLLETRSLEARLLEQRSWETQPRETGPARASPPEVQPIHAAAEETGLPAGSFDLVAVADALHWIDPERAGLEIGRLLAPGGAVAVVEAAPASTPFMEAIGALIQAANPRRPPPATDRLRQLLALAGAEAEAAERFAAEDLLDGPALEGVLRSFSHVGPALGPEPLARLIAEARALAARHGGARWARILTLTLARRRA